jgi:hypothetical protein
MSYRATYHNRPNRGGTAKVGHIQDIFDGKDYLHLLETEIVLNHQGTGEKFFASDWDVALGLSTDGFCPFKRRQHSAWPLIIFNYNLPPEIRVWTEHIICLGVIPGPKAVKDLDSFLEPLIDELLKLAKGVPVFDAVANEMFNFRAHLLKAFGDMPAIAKLMRMKGHNGFCSCRFCKITGVRIPMSTNKTHYVPLDRSTHPNPNSIPCFDPAELPMRTHAEMVSQARAVDAALLQSSAESERLSKACGINGVSSLFRLPSISFPFACPIDFMHLLYENVIPNLVRLWNGSFKELGSDPDCRIPSADWDAIGRACGASGATIPSQLGGRVPNLAQHPGEMTAEAWSFWTLYLAPIVLHNQFTDATFYQHFLQLRSLVELCIQYDISFKELDEIEKGFREWVVEYERYRISNRHHPQTLIARSLARIADSTTSTIHNASVLVPPPSTGFSMSPVQCGQRGQYGSTGRLGWSASAAMCSEPSNRVDFRGPK